MASVAGWLGLNDTLIAAVSLQYESTVILYAIVNAGYFRPNCGKEELLSSRNPRLTVKDGMNPKKQFTQLHYLKVCSQQSMLYIQ